MIYIYTICVASSFLLYLGSWVSAVLIGLISVKLWSPNTRNLQSLPLWVSVLPATNLAQVLHIFPRKILQLRGHSGEINFINEMKL